MIYTGMHRELAPFFFSCYNGIFGSFLCEWIRQLISKFAKCLSDPWPAQQGHNRLPERRQNGARFSEKRRKSTSGRGKEWASELEFLNNLWRLGTE
jgi:hypothetical protein